MAPVQRARIGTSGWSYDHWKGVFYPDRLAASKRLAYYATRFSTVEIDGTFYRLPSESTVRSWRDAVPSEFRFAVKGSRLITHYQRLGGPPEIASSFMQRMSLLEEKLAVVLWQLPPTLTCDLDLLSRFLEGLPRAPSVRHAVEFRHESWLGPRTESVLREHGVARVRVSSDRMPQDLSSATGFVYVRFHGTEEYRGAYERSALEPWCGFLHDELASGHDCYVYFNNDAEGHAPRDAARLEEMLGEYVSVPQRG